MEKHILGRKDILSFPNFGLENVPVKIDTGAYSCSVHCESVYHDEINNILEVVFLDATEPGYTGEKKLFTSFKRKTVKSSNGLQEERFFIDGNVKLFDQVIGTRFSLTTRAGLRNPVLLGRKLLNKRFLVDTSLINCSFNFEKKHR